MVTQTGEMQIALENGTHVEHVLEEANREYDLPDVRNFARNASLQEADEAMCNPIYQACLLNQEKSQLNIQLGLCVGHDSLFFKYAEAPTTVLAVKDRVTGHNPLAAIYLSESYYRKVRHPKIVSAK